MDTAPSDPLDIIWTAAERAAAREAHRKAGRKAAETIIADVPGHLREGLNPEAWLEGNADEWGRAFDEYIDRARQIISSPEAAGREALARHLITATSHGPAAARIILRDAGSDMAALPVGGERTKRLAAIRLAASAPGGL